MNKLRLSTNTPKTAKKKKYKSEYEWGKTRKLRRQNPLKYKNSFWLLNAKGQSIRIDYDEQTNRYYNATTPEVNNSGVVDNMDDEESIIAEQQELEQAEQTLSPLVEGLLGWSPNKQRFIRGELKWLARQPKSTQKQAAKIYNHIHQKVEFNKLDSRVRYLQKQSLQQIRKSGNKEKEWLYRYAKGTNTVQKLASLSSAQSVSYAKRNGLNIEEVFTKLLKGKK